MKITGRSFLLACALFACSSAETLAQTGLSATEIQYVDFGVIPSTARTCNMNVNGNLSGDCVGAGTTGEMEIRGTPWYSYAASVSSHGWIRDVRFTPSLPKKQNFMLDSTGRGKVIIAGQFQLKPNRPLKGVLRTTYTFTVYYQ